MAKNYVEYFEMQDAGNVYVRDVEAHEELAQKANTSSVNALTIRMNSAETALDGKANQSNLNSLSETVQGISNDTTALNASVGNIRTELTSTTQKATQNTADIAALSGRVDSFTQLPSGSTAADAELIDIRNAGNGVRYSTAGDAVRGEYVALNNVLTKANKNYKMQSYPFSAGTWNGGTWSWNKSTREFTVTRSGTSSNPSNNDIYSSSSALPNGIMAGKVYNVLTNLPANSQVLGYVYFYNSSSSIFKTICLNDVNQILVPASAVGMILRVQLPAGSNSVNFTGYVELVDVDVDNGSAVVLPSKKNLAGARDKSEIIMALLTQYGSVSLGSGTYYLESAITMPDNSAIIGTGANSVIKQMSYDTHGIIPGSRCTIQNVNIEGVSTTVTQNKGVNAGIFIEGNGDSAPFKLNIKIAGCIINGWSLAGIYIHNTGYWDACSVSAVNCEMQTCHAGVFCDELGEYNRFTNILARGCYYGVWNDGGNNVYANCTLTENHIGAYSNPIEDGVQKANSGHGSFIGCTFNHNDSNNGYSIFFYGVQNGMIFDGCQFWYGKVRFQNCVGTMAISDSLIGGGESTLIENMNSQFMILNGCYFKSTPVFDGTIAKVNCYSFDGNVI